ncbi:hypothetical protein Q4506_10525 [Colwellia sp. 4_MG-2023]|jgi:hypothetical protein|uniref:hypothetical protein n=1 Tax=unclassified Colwellia TaxID=196834 RepID=UPI001C09384C|nr:MULTISPECIES: hypothetical protein [unclassified Colwellia]MBU2925973.1 hypothetical protein [Colwellia sp. C2M11]MDO6488453.1 hypothetical protein [Colwellia sp. 6_MG-2023]MDO6507458.1 hypothetical protein [Colwellia sp. 5_MG-2023]MDO6556122.1 hypothetical protein [Colwellia sp. 4_MG-2023]MDO6652629.1 hypothetical protein [Colwellia sp. 3_MG-2023]
MNSVHNEVSGVQEATIKKSNRRSFLLMIVVFLLPVILAKLALDGEWLAKSVTNKGTLLTEELTLDKLGIDNSAFEHQWLILYSLPLNCEENCQHTLESVHNTYVALGKYMPRVTPVALYQSVLSNDQLQHLSQSQWQLVATPSKAKTIITEQKIWLVDPLGNVFMSHEIPNDTKQLPHFGKQILADMKKILKYSKVG